MSVNVPAPKLLKVGIVCEGQRGCAETQVFPHLVKLICPKAICGQAEIVPSGNRPKVLQEAPIVARILLDSGCDAVFVMWDVFPEWREQGGTTDCRVHCKTLADNLQAAGMVDLPIIPVAIHEELEAWLLCDADALMATIGQRLQKKNIPHERRPDRVQEPKKKLERLFQLARRNTYNPSISAGKIAQQLMSTKRLRKSQSFLRFEAKLSDLCK